MPCSPKTARIKLDAAIDTASTAFRNDFRHTVKYGGKRITIFAPCGLPAIFLEGLNDDDQPGPDTALYSKRFVLQLIETYGDEARR